ncbi:centrosomal protein, putative (macronuclear) [Tetrahymena thermophila SB210]|uniref:Centrosomal protein, putative n=1 Tax=Tetrahymena thermophila (strain SB210) TaxID=312017 RepID=Q23FN3_TETTS|nr:centrosomal protein, putative [Tetrahymena thermophila SB210]EAR95577.1 centrosomal protein, putative [Tetrahymena thermophila SB210]|eukprot:XP_001015822.1 centrosomal protein, putative [Tetrahymena thermophila SB210]
MSKQQQNMQKLAYKIKSCSSEEQTHRVSELLMQSPQSKGWQSSRFCDYPQEIVLQFHSPVRVRQIQFLSHQYKIASRIEIFVYMPDQNTPFINTEFKYKKLGYLSLDSNEKTGFKSRELKSVYVDSPALYLKLSFHKNHNNKYNTFNQIGVIALSCFGDDLTNMKQNIEPVKEFYNQIQYQTQFDHVTLDRLRTLEMAKERAVKNDDFDEAQRLKEAIDKLKAIGIQLRQLNERKQIATENEDYDAAKIIKAEIDRLRNAVAPEYLIQKPQPLQYNSNIPYNSNQFQPLMQDPIIPSNQPDMWSSKPVSKPSNNNFKAENDEYGNQLNKIEEAPLVEQETTEMARQHRSSVQQPQYEESKQDKIQKQKFEEQFMFNNRTNQGSNHDEMQLPAMKNKQNKKPWELDDAYANGQAPESVQQNSVGETEQLSGAAKQQAEPLIPVIGDECAAKIFSKSWQIREEGLKWLEAEAQNPRSINGSDPQALFTAVIGVCSATIADKVAQVSQASMNLLQALCNSRSAKPTSVKGETGSYVDNCIGLLMEQAGHHVPKVREQAEQALFALGSVPIIGNQTIVQSLSKGSGLKPKMQSSIKHIVARLNILQQFSKRFSIGKKDVPLAPVMEYAAKQMVHANNEVRTSAINLITEAYNQVGEGQIEPYIANLPEQQRDILSEAFSQNGGGGGKNSSPQKQEKKTVVTTNIQHQGARHDDKGPNKKGKQPSANDKSPSQKDSKKQNNSSKMQASDVMEVCEFCHVHNPTFADKKDLDIHLWRECPMLLLCPHCAQVVEVSAYNQHLLEECKKAMKFRQCPRCKEAISVTEYNDHVKEKSCLPHKSPSVANRCPLCHQDIEQGPEGWRKHLVVQGCPNNERSTG